MKSKVFLLTTALLALPAVAHAANEPAVTLPTGTRLAIGSKIKGRNIGQPKVTTALENLSCSTMELTGTLKKNTGTELEADIETAKAGGTGSGGTCTVPQGGTMNWTFNSTTNGVPWCLRSTPAMAADEVQIRGGRCSEAARPIRIVEDGPGCTWERASALVGTLTTDPEDAVVTFSNQLFKRTSICFFNSDMDFDFTLTFESDEGFGPLYFS